MADYSLEIVIAIINNDYFERIYAIVWSCMPYKIYIKKRLKTLLLNFYCFSMELSLKCQLYIGLFSSLNKNKKIFVIVALKDYVIVASIIVIAIRNLINCAALLCR